MHHPCCHDREPSVARQAGKNVVVQRIERLVKIKQFHRHTVTTKPLHKLVECLGGLIDLGSAGRSHSLESSPHRSFTTSGEDHPFVASLIGEDV
ncbi:MAG: Uncharacterised protein [Cellulomonadaceae bacterium TMED98]|nr:MAG: Uncharacterised protein [Cellulomonadaceae bacterium TMED98]